MTERYETELPRRERQIMDAIYAAGSATAAEVVDALPDPLSNSTVRTQLRILVEKGYLKQERDGQRYIYRPARPRRQAARGALKRVVETFFGGSVERAVVGLLRSSDVELDEAELERLQEMIERAREERR